MRSEQFEIGFSITEGQNEQLFLSVTEGFEHGPGIQRDGITEPRMRDPHSVEEVVIRFGLDGTGWHKLRSTTNPYVQRAGTWTLYHHLKRFHTKYGKNWRIIGVQSNGDLTMNFWHVAFQNLGKATTICALRTGSNDEMEPIDQRSYRCLVKWSDAAVKFRRIRYEFIELSFFQLPAVGWIVKISDPELATMHDKWLTKLTDYDSKVRNIGPFIEFSLSGKPIVENGIEISLSNAIDRFQDVRHIFNLPEVTAAGSYHGSNVKKINFGEYQLYRNVNERRAALSAPVVIKQNVEGWVTTEWEAVRNTLKQRHYRETTESPTRRGQFRRYSEGEIEIFFPHNVYPFGVLGIRPSEANPDHGRDIIGLSSGGLSGRVGNTLEATAQIMFDFFGCSDAVVLDEGYDVFCLTNPFRDKKFLYSNEELLHRVLSFTRHRVDQDAADASTKSAEYALGPNMREWPLNQGLMAELDNDYTALRKDVPYDDVMVVTPHRSQMRSVLVFATAESQLEGKRDSD